MAKTLGVVTVTDGLHGANPAALAHRQLGGLTLLQWLVRRIRDCRTLDDVVVIAPRLAASIGTTGQSDDRESTVSVPFFSRGDDDMLGNVAAAIKHHAADAAVLVSAGHPFVATALIDRLSGAAKRRGGCDYVGFFSAAGRSSLLASLGMIAEWCRGDALLRADRDASDPDERREATRHIFSHPEKFQLRLVPLPPGYERRDIRLAMRVEEDWEHARTVYNSLGPEHLDWASIAQLIDEQPHLRARMQQLNRSESR